MNDTQGRKPAVLFNSLYNSLVRKIGLLFWKINQFVYKLILFIQI